MCSDETDIHPLDCELYHDYQPMVVTPDIEHIMLIPHIVNAVEILLDIGKTGPVGFLYCFEPCL